VEEETDRKEETVKMREITRSYAQRIRSKLLSAPVAPGMYSHLINGGTGKVLDILEEQYLSKDLAEGISCFKYLEGDYGMGKSQFIHCLAERARRHDIVTAVVTIGQECPFNSPLSIYKSIMSSFLSPNAEEEEKGIETLLRGWIVEKLKEGGVSNGQEVPETIRSQIDRCLRMPWVGAPDTQTAIALTAAGLRLLALECGADLSATDQELFSWLRGDQVRSKALKDRGLHEPARDETAFRRLKTVVSFLRNRLGYRGFFIAFDEGTRTASFRRGSVKQKQAVENMLSMINDNAEGQFGGVMFLYAATPDFRSEEISKYRALNDRIGTVAFLPGRPMTPLIVLDDLLGEEALFEIGENLVEVFAKADGFEYRRELQRANMEALIRAQKEREFFDKVPPRYFVYHFCALLEDQAQAHKERVLSDEEARVFVQSHELPAEESR